MTSNFARGELARLRAMRERLVSIEARPAGTPAPRYWDRPADLELYDAVFGRRIAWKWRAVLDELEQRGGLPRAETVLDWGTGTGVAAREWLARSPEARVTLWDRDAGARAFAAERVREEAPAAHVVEVAAPPAGEFDLALVSHVLDELEDEETEALLATLRRAAAVVWVEPGSRLTSRRLSAARDALLADFDVLAPCTHRERCGMLAEGQERNWCHLFARPAPEVFTDGRWAEIGRELGIDLRSVPYSFVALQRRAGAAPAAGGARLLGRPRVQRGRALIDTCEASGLREEALLKRVDRALFKTLGDTAGQAVVLDLEREGGRIVRASRR